MFSLDPRSKRVAQGAERSQPVEVKHRKKKREVDLLFPLQQVLVGQKGWRWKYSKRFHLWFHPDDNLLPGMWCFTWPRETRWCWARFKHDHILQTLKKSVGDALCLIWSPHPFPLQLLCLTGISSSSFSCCFLWFIFMRVAADWNVSPRKLKWIKSINRFSCFPAALYTLEFKKRTNECPSCFWRDWKLLSD